MWDEVALIVGSYILGALPLIYLMGRLHGIDLREYEDMHLALWRNVNPVEGLAGLCFDFAKGVIAVLVARAAGFEVGWVAFAGVAAVVGQMWPVFFKFEGEKGNSVGSAMAAALAWQAFVLAAVPGAIGAAIRTIPRLRQPGQTMKDRAKLGGPPSLSLPAGMAVSFAVLPLVAWWRDEPWQVIVALAGMFVLIMIRRLTAGMSENMRRPSGKKRVFLNRFLFDRSEI
jgi:glycerol-3-phosphate acyltransferase PlsY